MRIVWTGKVGDTFVVRDVQERMPELAYTTVMTTLNRLTEKGLLRARALPQKRAHEYRLALTPAEFLDRSSRHDIDRVVKRYGDLALAAFAARLDRVSPQQRQRLRELLDR